jgi:hypothetical protein
MLIVENYVLATSPDLCTAFLLLLTLPVTVAASERSFSKLKLIKNYLRSSMGADAAEWTCNYFHRTRPCY